MPKEFCAHFVHFRIIAFGIIQDTSLAASTLVKKTPKKHRSWLCLEILDEKMFGFRLYLDELYEIARETSTNRVGRKENAPKSVSFFLTLVPCFWPFPSKFMQCIYDLVEHQSFLQCQKSIRSQQQCFSLGVP